MIVNWGTPKLWKGNLKCFDITEGNFDKEVSVYAEGELIEAWIYTSGGPKAKTSPGTWQISYYPDAPWYWKWAAWYIAYSFSWFTLALGAVWNHNTNTSRI